VRLLPFDKLRAGVLTPRNDRKGERRDDKRGVETRKFAVEL